MKQIIRRVAALIVGLGLSVTLSVTALAGLETVTHISDLNASWPLGSDLASTSDDHIRNIKTALKTDFPNITGPVTVTQTQINTVVGSGVTGAANPTGSVGTTAVNGSATTFMRSDGAPAINQAISPTWTGAHTFSSLVGNGATTFQGANTGSGYNIKFRDTTNSTDRGFIGIGTTTISGLGVADFGITSGVGGRVVIGAANGANLGLVVSGSGATTQVQGYGPIAGALVDVTADTGTFTATYTGFTAGVTCTATWSRIGKLVSLFFCTATGTSNSTSFTMTGLPSAIQPASLTQTVALPIGPVQNASLIDTTPSVTVTASSGTVTFLHTGSSIGWTNSGTKGFSSGATISYILN